MLAPLELAKRLIRGSSPRRQGVVPAAVTMSRRSATWWQCRRRWPSLPLGSSRARAARLVHRLLERHAFYERARGARAVVRTGELRPYGNILVVKGVINRYGPVRGGPGERGARHGRRLRLDQPRSRRPGVAFSAARRNAGRRFVRDVPGRQRRESGAGRGARRRRVAMVGAVGRDAFAAQALAELIAGGVDSFGGPIGRLPQRRCVDRGRWVRREPDRDGRRRQRPRQCG